MLLALLASTDLYHPSGPGSHAPWDVLVVALVLIGFVALVAGLATIGRRPPERED